MLAVELDLCPQQLRPSNPGPDLLQNLAREHVARVLPNGAKLMSREAKTSTHDECPNRGG
jgi:hypothetical protein